MRWYHNKEDGQWELVGQARPANSFPFDHEAMSLGRGIDVETHTIFCIIRDEVVTGIDLGQGGLQSLLDETYPEWPQFPTKEERDKQ